MLAALLALAAPLPADAQTEGPGTMHAALSAGPLPPMAAPMPRADERLRPAFAPALDAPTLPGRTAMASGRARSWAMVGVGIGMILAGAKLEETPAEPLGALIRYTGYAVIVFTPFGG